MATTYNETRVNLANVIQFDKDGKTPIVDDKTNQPATSVEENITEKKANELMAAQKTAGQPDVEVVKIQTFVYTEVAGDSVDAILADFKGLVSKYQTDEAKATKVTADIINRGLVLAQQKQGRDFMSDKDQSAVEGAYDLCTDAFVPGEGRRKADPRSAAAKNLSALLGRTVTVEEVDQLLASFQAPAAVQA